MNTLRIYAKKLYDKAANIVKCIGKRNLSIAMALVLIAGAVWLNYRIFSENAGALGTLYYQGQTDTQVGGEGENGKDDYFASTILTRQRSRDEALAVLQTIVSSEDALPESVSDAIAEMNQIAKDMENESNIETLVKAKGFADCVAVISGGKCSVIVKCDGLLPNHVAQIQEIVYEQASILPENVKMVEKQG